VKAAKHRDPDRDGESSLRILLVEDNESDALIAQAAVDKAVHGPHEILRAATLENGLAILRLGRVDLVLLDLNLPDSRGVNTLNRMRVATPCPIVVITAEERPGLDEEALGNGAFEILHKGRLGTDTIARLLRLAEERHRSQGSLENAEHRFRSLIELSSDWYWEQDETLRFTYYSPGFAERSGATPEALLGRRRWDEPGRAPLRGTWAQHRAMLKARKPFRDQEFVRLNKDGTRSFQSVTGEPFFDRGGKFAGYRGSSRDITERKLAEEALDHTRARLELALAASRVCTWDYDLRSGAVLLSESWAEIIGAPPGETRTTVTALVEMVHPEDAAALRGALTETVKNRRTEYSVEHRVRHQSGEWRWIVSRGKVVERDARQRAVRVVGSNLDISDHKRAEDQLRENEDRYRKLIDLSPDAIFVHSDWRIVLVNQAMLRLFHAQSAQQLLGREVLELVAPESCENVRVRITQMYERQVSVPAAEIVYLRADGSRFSAEVTAGAFSYAGRPAAQVVARDVTERKLAEHALAQSERRFREFAQASAEWFWETDAQGRISWTSEYLSQHSGLERGRLIGMDRIAWIAQGADASAEPFASHARIFRRHEAFRDFRFLQRWPNGERWVSSSGVPRFNDAGEFLGYRGTATDVTQRKRAEETLRESEERFRSLTKLSSDWYWEQDAELRFTYISPSFSERSDGDPAKILGRQRWDFEDVVPASGIWPDHRATLEAHRPFRDFEQIRVRTDGTRQFIASSGMPIFDAAGNFTGYRGVSSDITSRKSAEKRLVYLAQFDAVTGLPNRNLLQEKLENAIVQSRRRGRGAGVLFIDLDRFKLVNDSLGHDVGDALLLQVGRSLHDCVRQDDTVGRLAGDEFAVVIADLARQEDAAIVAQKIVDSFATPFDLEGQEIFLTASIGIAAFPGDGADANALLGCADAAMYRAKESSRNSFCFYTAEMNARTTVKLQLNNDLRRAVERAEFRLHYQPKVNLATGALTGMEALLRWQHPERGMVAPLDFIPALEDTGLIVAVGDWVVEEACRQLRDWTRDGLVPVPIAVNLSARQFRRRDLDAVIRGIVAGYGLQAGLLELEITESSLMADPVDAIRQLHALRAAGLRISVDDFGTGYSSLSYLTRLPLSTLKIDRSFVNAAIGDPHSAAIVRMVIDMAQNLRFSVVAEGIETVEHVAFLRQHGCEQGQGYHFGRPAPAAQIAARLSRRA
jgi:diguanylate cyclase (GGDEF)-like protein/PAS domain S-box-containing protein